MIPHVTQFDEADITELEAIRERLKAEAAAKGALGQKAGAGFYRKQGREIQVLDPLKADYRASAGEVAPEVTEILKIRNPGEKLGKLRASAHPQAQFLWATFRDVFHYCALQLESIANNARVRLNWIDASAIEDGYRVYRDGVLVHTSAANAMAKRSGSDWACSLVLRKTFFFRALLRACRSASGPPTREASPPSRRSLRTT